MTLLSDRLDLVVIARIATSTQRPSIASLATATKRFSPATLDSNAWTALVSESAERTTSLDAAKELTRRTGIREPRAWKRLAERVLPALALGVSPTDDKTIARLAGRDQWMAAIAARALGFWTGGPPPSLSSVLDAYAWHSLGLSGRAKRCPPEVRALFLQRELQSDPGPPDRLLRLFVARVVGAARPELRVVRDALVRNWLSGRTVGPTAFADEVRSAARAADHGVFGERKVFISAVWDQLRRDGQWSSLSIADFKKRLLEARRAGAIELARADLVAAMDPHLVAASETLADGASFHFIVREKT